MGVSYSVFSILMFHNFRCSKLVNWPILVEDGTSDEQTRFGVQENFIINLNITATVLKDG